MGAQKRMTFVKLCEVLGWVLRDVVGPKVRRTVAECPADYLLELARVQVDARSETCHCEFCRRMFPK